MKRIAPIFALALSTACAAKSADTAEPAATKAATDVPTRAGTYSLSTSDFVATPAGCRDSEGDDHEAWSLEMADPAGGKWSATDSPRSKRSAGPASTGIAALNLPSGPDRSASS